MISFAIFGPTSHGRSITTIPAPNLSSGSPKNVVGGDGQIAGQRKLEPSGKTGAADGRDGRLGRVPKPHHGFEVPAQDRLRLGQTGRAAFHPLLEIEAGRERGAAALYDQSTNLRVLFRFVDRYADLGEHRLVEGVGALRPVQCDPRDTIEPLVDDRGQGRRPSLRRCPRHLSISRAGADAKRPGSMMSIVRIPMRFPFRPARRCIVRLVPWTVVTGAVSCRV
jgi:hypothetical protein